MIDTILKLLASFVKLIEVRNKNNKEYFTNYVDPTYKLAERVYTDYLKLFTELETKVRRCRKTQSIVRFVEERRLQNLAIRIKLRAIIRNREKYEAKNAFEEGIYELMYLTGGGFDEQTTTSRHAKRAKSLKEMEVAMVEDRIKGASGGHYLLDIVNWIVHSGEEDLVPIRRELLNIVRHVRLNIDDAWRRTVTGYADLQSLAIPKVRRKES